MKSTEKSLQFDYYDSPYTVFAAKGGSAIGSSETPFGPKTGANMTFHVEEFNTVEMKLYNDLKVVQDTLQMVNRGFAENKQSRLYREQVKVSV